MRIFKIASIVMGGAMLFTALHFSYGIFNRFSFITAYVDKWTGTERIVVYGELMPTDHLKATLAPKFGFSFERHEDCNVTTPFVNGVEDYNAIMDRTINARLGKDWNALLNEEITKTNLPALNE